jgi:hypothetical protein
MQSIFGPRVAFQTYSQRRGLLQRFGMGAAAGVLDGLDERLAYSRFGL